MLAVAPFSVASGLVKLDAAQWAIAVGATFSLISLGDFLLIWLKVQSFMV